MDAMKALNTSVFGGYAGKPVANRTNLNTGSFLSNGTDTVNTYRTQHFFPGGASGLRLVFWNGSVTSTNTESGPGNSVTYTAAVEFGGNVLTLLVTAGGSGYTSIPTVTLSAPTGGTTATATAIVSGGVVTGIVMTNPGSMYTSAPTVTIAGGGGNGAAATATISAVTTVPCAFAGNASSLVLANLAMGMTEVVPVDIPAGTIAYSRTCATVTSGNKWYMGLTGYGADSKTTGSDVTTGTGALGTTQSNQAQLAPVAILGVTAVPSVKVIGDSITHGYYDALNGIAADQGYFNRFATNFCGYVQMSKPSTQAGQWVLPANLANRTRLYSAGDWTWILLGVNDISNGVTLAALQQYLTALIARERAHGKLIAVGTLPPHTTSTDAWRTTANQTVLGGGAEAARTGYNDWIRTLCGGLIDGYGELADAVETARNSGIWKPPTVTSATGTATSADSSHINDTSKTWTVSAFRGLVVHITGGTGAGQARTIAENSATQLTCYPNGWTTPPDATSTYAITNAYTPDGLHPSFTGHIAMAAVLTSAYSIGSLFAPNFVAGTVGLTAAQAQTVLNAQTMTTVTITAAKAAAKGSTGTVPVQINDVNYSVPVGTPTTLPASVVDLLTKTGYL